ncbi:MAG: hypothetical protein QXQ40_00565 [Candidatus Aenigmatarchaeota archaeon]
MKGIAPIVWIIGTVVLSVVGTFFLIILVLTSSTEIRLSDKVGYGLSGINLFYLTEKVIEEDVYLAIETSAMELGKMCGGISCEKECYWSVSCPTTSEALEKYKEEIKRRLNHLPEHIGKYNLTGPKVNEIYIEDDKVSINLSSHIISMEDDEFNISISKDEINLKKEITYPLLIKLGRKFIEDGVLAKELDKKLIIKTSATMQRGDSCPSIEELLRLTDYYTIDRIIGSAVNYDINMLILKEEPYNLATCKAELENVKKEYVPLAISCEEYEDYFEGSIDFAFYIETTVKFSCSDEKYKIPLSGRDELSELELHFFVTSSSIVSKSVSKSVMG